MVRKLHPMQANGLRRLPVVVMNYPTKDIVPADSPLSDRRVPCHRALLMEAFTRRVPGAGMIEIRHILREPLRQVSFVHNQ